jgi:hypothetical protein
MSRYISTSARLQRGHKAVSGQNLSGTILKSAPSQALIFTTGDEATFSLWYFHYAYRQRPDVAVICMDLLVQPWYRSVLRYTYPHLVVPDTPWMDDLARANSHRPVCQLKSDLQPQIECTGQ